MSLPTSLFEPRSRMLFLTAACALFVGASSCKHTSSTPTTPSGPSSSTSITIPANGGYGDTTFTPSTLTVTAGSTVTWNNKDSVAHNPTSDTNLFTGDLQPGGAYSRTFDTKGTFKYHCTIHPSMTGTINVQ